MMMQCPTCGREFQFGPHIYAGVYIPAYKMTVCRGCYSANWDGWGPAYEGKILDHLKREGIPEPQRNENGRLPLGK